MVGMLSQAGGRVGSPATRGSFAGAWRARSRGLVLTDVASILAAEVTAILVRLPTYGPSDTLDWSLRSVLVTIGLLAGWMWALSVMRTRDRRVVGVGPQEYSRIALATWWTFAVLAIVSYVFKLSLTRSYVAIALPVGLVLLLLTRYLWRRRLHISRLHGRMLADVLVVGHPGPAAELARLMRARPAIGYRPVGVCVPAGEARPGAEVAGVPVVGDLDHVPAAARVLGVDVVAAAGHDAMVAGYVRRLGWALEPDRIDLLLASSLTDVAGPRMIATPVEGAHLVHLDAPTFSGPKYVAKLLLDTLGAALLVLLAAPLLLVIAILVRVTSPGPAIFRQVRVGRDGRPFTMYKYRSMTQDAETRLPEVSDRDEGNSLLFKVREDPRVTSVGRVLRRYSLDELPQLFNVLRGDMSLVGPRPPLESEVAQYDARISRRLLVKPGMTGLWQVSGRSDLPLDESVRYDLYYVENWSLFGDLLILARTSRAVLRGEGAY